jgi:hypothetical protein
LAIEGWIDALIGWVCDAMPASSGGEKFPCKMCVADRPSENQASGGNNVCRRVRVKTQRQAPARPPARRSCGLGFAVPPFPHKLHLPPALLRPHLRLRLLLLLLLLRAGAPCSALCSRSPLLVASHITAPAPPPPPSRDPGLSSELTAPIPPERPPASSSGPVGRGDLSGCVSGGLRSSGGVVARRRCPLVAPCRRHMTAAVRERGEGGAPCRRTD